MLVVLAVGEAGLAVLFAAALDRLLIDQGASAMPVLGAAGLVLMAGLVMLVARWMGEKFAQGFVTDCRAALFRAVTRHAGEGGDARWVTVLINDLAALRNYALRGTVRLWTSATAASAAAVWVFLTMPDLRASLVPLVFGAFAILLLVWPLTRAITRQRSQRGRLNRFLVRRVRAELAGEPSTRGHGFRKLSVLSNDLAHAAIHRAASAAAMDAVATLAGLAAALVIVWQTIGSQDTAGLAGNLTLLGFIAGRLLESARALHARIGGRIALERLSRLLARPPASEGLPRRARPHRAKPGKSARAAHAGLALPHQPPQSHTSPSESLS